MRVEGLRQGLEDLGAGRTSGYVETDAFGRFTLDGLLDRPYEITARLNGREITSDPVDAGTTDLVLELR